MIDQLMTNGGAYIGDEAKSGRDFIGRDRISITVEESYLQQIWTRLDADLQDALSLAGNQVLREGGEAIALTHLLRAIVRLRPDLAEEILPLLLLYQGRSPAQATVTEAQKARRLMDIDATLQAVFGGLLANHDANHRLSCVELLDVLRPDPDRPCPGLWGGLVLPQPQGNAYAADSKVGFHGADAGPTTAQWVYWKTMWQEEAQACWN